jgi:hypothetical protein
VPRPLFVVAVDPPIEGLPVLIRELAQLDAAVRNTGRRRTKLERETLPDGELGGLAMKRVALILTRDHRCRPNPTQ